jgi:hypothetical protein
MNRANDVVGFSQTLKPLALGTLAGVAVLTGLLMMENLGRHDFPQAFVIAPFLALRIAPFCYGGAVLFVVPILAVWPAMRRPTYAVAAIWGVLAARAALALLTWVSGQRIRVEWWAELQAVWPFAAAGAASGLLYAYIVRRRRHPHTVSLIHE